MQTIPVQNFNHCDAPLSGDYAGLTMRNLFRALVAGYTAKKLGGGCITTVILFIILYWLLGYLF